MCYRTTSTKLIFTPRKTVVYIYLVLEILRSLNSLDNKTCLGFMQGKKSIIIPNYFILLSVVPVKHMIGYILNWPECCQDKM